MNEATERNKARAARKTSAGSEENRVERNQEAQAGPAIGGWAGWIWKRWRSARRPRARLELLERITLAPRQTVALVEADGRRFLVATSAEGSPAFLALGGGAGRRPMTIPAKTIAARRISW